MSGSSHLVFAIFAGLFMCVCARSTGLVRSEEKWSSSENTFIGDLKFVYKIYEDCSSQELMSCLKIKLIDGVDRLAKKVEIPITESVSLTKEGAVAPDDVAGGISEDNNQLLQANFPRSADERNSRLDDIIMAKAVDFLSTRVVQFKLSSLGRMFRENFQEGVVEGRGKKNKYNPLMLYPLVMGSSIIPFALGTLLLLAGKALIIAKLALALTLIFGVKKMLGGYDHSSYQIYSHNLVPFRRSLENHEAAQALAYQAYLPYTTDASTNLIVS